MIGVEGENLELSSCLTLVWMRTMLMLNDTNANFEIDFTKRDDGAEDD
jgi:hypothetical protein